MIQDDFKVQGWISLHRKLMHWKWYKVPHMTNLFVHLMLRANRLEGESRGTIIKPGQFATSLQELSNDTGISVRSVRTCLSRMVATREIDMESTNVGRIITVRNFLKYQQLESGVDYNTTETDKYPTNKTTRKATNNPTNKKQSGLAALLSDTESNEEKTTSKTTRETTKKAATNNNIDKYNNKEKQHNKSEENPPVVTAKKSDYLDEIVNSFRARFVEVHNRPYIITNHQRERVNASKILAVFKTENPNADSGTMLQLLSNYFKQALTVRDNWLRNNMSISIAYTKYNAISNIINEENKNNHARSESKRTNETITRFNTTDW